MANEHSAFAERQTIILSCVVLTKFITNAASVVGMAAAVSSDMVAGHSSESTALTRSLTVGAKGALRAGVKTEVTSVASLTYTCAIFLLALTEHA